MNSSYPYQKGQNNNNANKPFNRDQYSGRSNSSDSASPKMPMMSEKVHTPPNSIPDDVPKNNTSRLEKWAYYIFIVMSVLVPLAFVPTRFVPIDLAKSVIIVLGSLISAILFGVIALRERKLSLPSKNIFWAGTMIVASLVFSSVISINAVKSLIGQGFEIGTAGLIGALFVSALVAFTLVSRRVERAFIIYTALAASYIILYLFHLLRLLFGQDFASLSILNSVTDSIVGNWYNLGIYSLIASIVSLVAIATLQLSNRLRVMSYLILALSILAAFFVNMPNIIWLCVTLLFIGLSIFFTMIRPRVGSSLVARLAWIPIVVCVLFALFAWRGDAVVRPINQNISGYSELSLPWQMTIDVTAGAIKNYPVFGVGPNHFVQAFLAYKPAMLNSTNVWNVEFTNGFGFIPTLVSAQGTVGTILWILFYIFLGIAGARALKNLPKDEKGRFIIISSYASSVFLWLVLIVYVPSHAILFITFLLTGIFFGAAHVHGSLDGYAYAPNPGSKSAKFLPVLIALLIIVAALWALAYAKKAIALSYFGQGMSELTVKGDPVLADAYFQKSQSIDSSDVYWQARAEASLLLAAKLSSTVTATSTASSTETVVAQVVKVTNDALQYSRKAIALDPTNYYNYVSEARVSETATSYKMTNGYENAVAAYAQAIGLNPFNPSLYLNLAKLQAKENKLDDSLRTIGAALQVKNNYLDAIFLLSQVDAAKGNLPEAITAAKVATQINPQNPLLFFQLGLLQYNYKDYAGSVAAFDQAVKLQPDYANAQYFLGLADVRINKIADAIVQFTNLQKANPDNQEINLILTNLRAGKPIFADAVPPVTPNPEKRTNLPIKEPKK